LYPAREARSTACPAREAPGAKQSLLKFHPARTNRLRASQNAAALLFDFGTVDIRRVGTQAKRILVAGCSE
jgi:hypothetical protein